MKTTIALFMVILLLVACSPSQTITQTVIGTTPTIFSTQTRLPTPTFTDTPSPFPTPIHPTNQITFHEADGEILYRWYSYIPLGLDRTKPVNILITALSGYMGTYDDETKIVESWLKDRLVWPNINNFVLLAPVIPRIDNPNQEEIYSIAFDLTSFKTTDTFARRADLKVIQIIDRLTGMLVEDGYQVNNKVMIEGFSAGALFAQRFTLLHPDRVRAIAAGGGSNFTLPLETYNDTPLNWPVGINDLQSLSGIDFDLAAYKDVSQFIFIGDQDHQVPNTVLFPDSWGATNMWESVAQRDFLRQTFGSEDPIRMKNEINYLNNNGFGNITLKIYPGIGHQETEAMVSDKMLFLIKVVDPMYVATPTPTPAVPIIIDGYGNDWAGIPSHNDPVDDSDNPAADISSYSFTQDQNYLFIILKTSMPIMEMQSTLDINIALKATSGALISYEFNFESSGRAYGGYSPDTMSQIPGALVVLKDVYEIQVPKLIFGDSTFKEITHITLFTDMNGSWTGVDAIP